MGESALVLFWTALLLGLRHSFDLDHVAAITDICAAETDRKKGILYSFGYSFGHALVVLVLGLVAMCLGVVLPPSVEVIMGKVVGVTLLVLAVAVIYTALRHRHSGQIVSRWRILASLTRKLTSWTRKNPDEKDAPASIGFWGSTLIGALHGVGVESPTQLLILTSAASVSQALGLTAVFSFIAGMVIANMVLAVVVVFGFQNAQRQKTVFLVLSLLSALFGAFMGIRLLLG